MIRFSVSKKGTVGADLTELERRVEVLKPGWLKRAKARTQKLSAAKSYNESSSIWGEITGVFRDLQANKCAFCERMVPEDGGELEHFRPKSEVRSWPRETDKTTWEGLKYLGDVETGEPLKAGYYKLAYALLNYAMACHHCNAILKKCFFPIAGMRKRRAAADPRKYEVERPDLIYPVGTLDEDPEDLLCFKGYLPFPVEEDTTKPAHRRALIAILFFKLFSDSTLLLERALAINSLYGALEGGSEEDNSMVNWMTQGKLTHTNCCRSFVDIYKKDRGLAVRLRQEALAYIDTKV